MSVNLDDRNYKELQEIAKSCCIPANIRKEQLLKAIKAHYEKDEKILQGVLNEVKIARAKRKKTKMSPARPRPKPKNKNSSIDGSDDNVDSTSGGLKDLVPYNRCVNSNLGSDFAVDQSYLDRLYQRQHSAYMDSVSQYDARLSNQLQSNYMASSTAMLQYNGLQKETLPNYSECNTSNYPSYHASSYYHQSCPSFSWMENPNPYFSMHDGFYQLPATKLFEPKVVIDSTKSYSMSQSGYYGVESNGIPPVEVDCSSNLLPNVPQLEASHASPANVSSPWNQSSVAPTPTHPNRVQFSSAEMYPYQPNELLNESYDFPAADNESISAEIDSASDADNRSLADDIADLLSMDNMDHDSAAINLLMSEFPRGEQSSLTLKNEQAYYTGSNRDNCADINSSTNDAPEAATWSQSSQNADNLNATVALPSSRTLQIENDGFQLPMFSALLRDSNTSTTDQNGIHSDSGYAGTDGTLSSINNGVTRDEPIEDTPYPDNQSQNDFLEIIDLDASPEAPTKAASVWYPPSHKLPDTTLTHERAAYTVENINGCNETETCDEDVEIVEPQPSNVVSTSLVPKNDACSQSSEASGLIYKKETLHQSKIMCNSTAVVHKFVKIFIPAEGKKAIFSQTTTRKKISDKIPSSSSSARQILKGHLETRACWYKSVGCPFEAKAHIVALHEKKCKFQAVYCPSESCSWREAFTGLIGHINDVHKEQVLDRQQFLYTIDRVASKNNRSFYTFYQIYKSTIYVIRVHIDEDKCVATVQYIPDTQGSSIRMRNLRGIMEFVAFPEKRRVKTWKGYIQPYSDTVDKRQTFNTMRIDVGDSAFIALYVCIC